MAEDCIEYKELESQIFGIKVGQFRIAKCIGLWREDYENYDYDLIVFRIPYQYGLFIRDVHIQGTQFGGTRYVGSLVTYELDSTKTIYEIENHYCRLANEEDLNECIRIGEESFVNPIDGINRFNVDPRFGKDEIKKYYTEWVKNIYNGESADEVIVYEEDGRIKGFISIKDIGNEIGHGMYNIPLNAVERSSRGKGIYKNMIHSVLNRIGNRVNIRTYLGNIGTEKVWTGLGAEIKGIEHIFHMWLKG